MMGLMGVEEAIAALAASGGWVLLCCAAHAAGAPPLHSAQHSARLPGMSRQPLCPGLAPPNTQTRARMWCVRTHTTSWT